MDARVVRIKSMSRKLKAFKKAAKSQVSLDQPRCGLCGKTDKLTKTECCDQWICDDEDNYRLFSYARNSCYRNHQRYTLCGYHHNEDHPGDWKTCTKCRNDFQREIEMYVYYGTNEYNFEKLRNPPKYKPTYCSACGGVIILSEGGYSTRGREYLCEACTMVEFPDLSR
jgi:hypothetical protein